MGLFDFFKKNKNSNPYKDLPPSFQKAMTILFPNGEDDHQRQLNELSQYFAKKYDRQEIDSNLIFILVGYLISGKTKTKDNALSQVLARPSNRMTTSDVEYLYTFAVSNHPKLQGLLIAEKIMDNLSDDGCDTDTLPNGYGRFGHTPSNPIPTKGVIGIYDYLSRLYDEDGKLVNCERVGTVENDISVHPIDVYRVNLPKEDDILYFSAYHKRTSTLSPSGYVLVDTNNIIISSSCTSKFPLRYRLSQELPTLPKLIGLTSYSCFSDRDLIGKDAQFIEAERENRAAITIANNGNFNDALERLEKAISLGSLNAVNNKFTVLHTAERFKQGYEFLMSTLGTENVTMRGLYNLAVMYYNGENDTNYHISKDIQRSYKFLLAVIIVPHNDMEENVDRTIERVKELMTRLESEDPSLLELKNKRLPSLRSPMVSDNNVNSNETTLAGSTELNYQDSTPTTDIYGTPLMNRLADIYDCIHSAAENMIREMVGMPELSENGKLELELLFASILSHDTDKNIALQSLLAGNEKFRELDITKVLLAIDRYHNQYQYDILNINVSQRVPLMEFARSHGKLKIATLPKQDSFGNIKAPIFVKNDTEILECHFAFWGEGTDTPDYIIKNKNNIVVDLSPEGEYVFRHIDDINQRIDDFMKYIAFCVYKSPLEYHYYLSGDEIEEAIKDIKRSKSNVVILSSPRVVHPSEFEETSNIAPTIHYAFSEGLRTLDVLSASTGLVGRFKHVSNNSI